MTGIFGNIAAKFSYKWLVYSSVGMAAFVTVSDQTGTTLALPRIGHEFSADIPTVQWLYLVYTLFISALLLPMGKLSDTLGRRRIYILGLTVFSAGAVMAYFGQEFHLLLVAKAIQGIGAAMVQANGLALMVEAFPNRQRASAIGLYMAAIGTGAVMGPVIGGLMIDVWGWRSMYLGIAVIGVMEILLSVYVIRDSARSTNQSRESRSIRSFDWIGAVLSAGVLSLLLISLTYSYRLGWTNQLVLTGLSMS
ncbi:MAG: MFS transporter, partial [Chloroflexota bacterium]|nr:MFS transporter [Chloroflexota bacterium]